MRRILPSGGAKSSTVVGVLLGVTSCALLTSTIVLAVLYAKERNRSLERADLDNLDSLCLTPYCIKAANYLLQSINRTVDPCENFYEYTCGNWIMNAKIPSDGVDVTAFSGIQSQLDERLIDLLANSSSSDSDLKAVKNARILYASCMNQALIETDGWPTLMNVIDGQLGGWPIAQGATWSASSFNIDNLLPLLSLYSSNRLYTVASGVNTLNSSVYNIVLGQGVLILGRKDIYASENEITVAYRQLMRDVALQWTNATAQVDTDVSAMFALEKNISQYVWTPVDTINRANERVRASLSNLTTVVNASFDFSTFVRRVYQSADVNLTDADVIIVSQLDYLRNVSLLVTQTPPRVLQNYLLWYLIYNMIEAMPQRFQAMKRKFDELLKGTSAEQPRSIVCSNTVNAVMGFAVSRQYVHKYFSSESRDKSIAIFAHIRDAFIGMIEDATWMDVDSRSKAVKKALAIAETIGYPQYVRDSNATQLEEQYARYQFNASYTHNTLLLMQLIAKEALQKLRQPTQRSTWYRPPTIINAFYLPSFNSIIFPAATLQSPIFNSDAPMYLNFGSVGTIMGHEITHGFDSVGRSFDKDGNQVPWWTNATSAAFDQKKQCIIDQYSNYTIAQVNMTIRGSMTQTENIADNGGLKAAFFAYKKWAQANPNADKPLPGLSEYTAEQLFFLNFGHLWCAKIRDSALTNMILTDTHAPYSHRVIGSTSNFVEFDRVFRCKPGQSNSRVNKCTVW